MNDRLFQVEVDSKKYFFSNKQDAKTFRDEVNKKAGVAVVSKGPDHIGNHGNNPRSKRRKGRVR